MSGMPVRDPAYQRLPVDERRRQLLDAGSQLFAERSFEEISMQEIAKSAGVSKPLLYHYFPSKVDLFKAAVAEKAAELQALIAPDGDDEPIQQLASTLDAYLRWIDANAQTWSKLMQSAATLPDAGELIDAFRQQTMTMILSRLTTNRRARPALRTAINGWLGYMDAAILDWVHNKDLDADKLRDLLLAAFAASILAAQQADPNIKLTLPTPD
jgi:AcrR family transcriptional regulator